MVLILILSIALFLILLVFLLSLFGFNQITRARNYSDEQCADLLEKNGFKIINYFEEHQKEDVGITSKDGLRLKGLYIEGDKNLNRTMIIVHGYMVSCTWSIQFADIFLRRGWSVLLVDQRRHGKSEGMYSTYGYMEKYDLDAWVNMIVDRNGKDCIIGLHGQSLGGGTVLEYASINKYVKFIIADCPYSDMTELMRHQLKYRHFPAYPLLKVIDMLMTNRAGFRMRDVSPISAIKDSNIPVMFIHGSDDNFVPTHMSMDMYKSKKDNKRLLIVDGAIHGNSYLVNKELYEKEMMAFVEEALQQ